MEDYILLISLCVAALSLAAAGILYLRYRRMKREKNRKIISQIREHDSLNREIERTRIEKQALESLLKSKIDHGGNP